LILGATLDVLINGVPHPEAVFINQGAYSVDVEYNDLVVITPHHEAFDFTPVLWDNAGNPVVQSEADKDFIGSLKHIAISGKVLDTDGGAISGASLEVIIDDGLYTGPQYAVHADGSFAFDMDWGKSLSLRPSADTWYFPAGIPNTANPQLVLPSVTSAQHHNFIGVPDFVIISGAITGLRGVNTHQITIHATGKGAYLDRNFEADATSGTYAMTVPVGWTGDLSVTSSVYPLVAVSPVFSNTLPVMADVIQNYDAVVHFTPITSGIVNGMATNTSGAVWGDYDNDGDLDIVVAGATRDLAAPSRNRVYRNNGNGVFQDMGFELPYGLVAPMVAWIDYNNDGYLDIAISQQEITGHAYTYIYRNDPDGGPQDRKFVQSAALPAGVVSGSKAMAWGDYNNDGFADVWISSFENGAAVSRIFRNEPAPTLDHPEERKFSDIAAVLPSVMLGSVAWGDYDNDGDLDVLLIGQTNAAIPATILRNNNGVFEDIHPGFSQQYWADSSAIWTDYNNDGYLDVVLGISSAPNFSVHIYRNVPDPAKPGGRGFISDTVAVPAGIMGGPVAVGDYNNDGYPDILLSGREYNTSGTSISSVAKVFRSDPDPAGPSGRIFRQESGAVLTGIESGSVAWGDFDNDKDLDILVSGGWNSGSNGSVYTPFIGIYKNELHSLLVNIKPDAPTGLSAVSGGPGSYTVTLYWNKASDTWTPQNGLMYNVYVKNGTGIEIGSPMSDLGSGWRKVVTIGGQDHNTSWTFKDLPQGIYSWGVQAIDTSFEGSDFTPGTTFMIQ
jgi:predicted nucleotidyltransferase